MEYKYKNLMKQKRGEICPYRGMSRAVSCKTDPYPINCIGEWSDWSECSTNCGNGSQTRNYNVIQSAEFNGSGCAFNQHDIQTEVVMLILRVPLIV